MTKRMVGVEHEGQGRMLAFSDEDAVFRIVGLDNSPVESGLVQSFRMDDQGNMVIQSATRTMTLRVVTTEGREEILGAWERYYDGSFRALLQDLRRNTGLNFSQALVDCKSGRRIYRRGWNGQGMFVVLQKGYPDGIAINANTAESTGIAKGTVMAFQPYLMFKTAEGTFVPWVASQTDLLAYDWVSEPVG